MDTLSSKKPKTMAELLPGLSGILSKESMQTLSAKVQPRQTIAQPRTAEKVTKPLTIAEMRADIMSLRINSPRRCAQGATTSKKRNWNSSVKVDKTISHTANGQLKNNPVRKVLNFQPKPKAVTNFRTTLAPETPKFPRPEFRAKKSVLLQARNNVRISGICNISETPVVNPPNKKRITPANKENVPKLNINNNIKKTLPPKIITHKKLVPVIPDTPLSNESWKSSCDASFLQKEKEINEVEEKAKALTDERTLENIAEVTPPVSTPFKDYRSVQEFFNHSNDNEKSMCHDDTIMCFDKTADSNENKREESVIVSLCDLLKKTSVQSSQKSTELEDLLQIKNETEHNIKMIEHSISALNKIKESQLVSLQSVQKLINEKKSINKKDSDKTLIEAKETQNVVHVKEEPPQENYKELSPRANSVIKSTPKSPTYRIPKKNACLRKKVFYKSMPNVSNDLVSPIRSDMGNKALSMYMKMKENMNFLTTPVANRRHDVPNTPALTSHNLQKQLDKLYGEN